MHKLVILIEPQSDWIAFDSAWPQFLHLVEKLPGLRRETSSSVEAFLYGGTPYARVHELYFDSLEEAQQALGTPEGRAAGQLLQGITYGHLALFFADHEEDNLENIRKYR